MPASNRQQPVLPADRGGTGLARVLTPGSCEEREEARGTGTSLTAGDADPDGIFTPEDLNTEQKLLGNIVEEFVKGEVEPRIGELEEKQDGLMADLLRKAADVGLLAGDIPERFGGMELSHSSSVVI
ncbi:MAG: acyl-CoA dehydrogenase family protein, partial [Deltaproteobacteria bacterium]|nr:acyl-CoA dehydrogenase family protein [Deltaproteobacteria bacterium]